MKKKDFISKLKTSKNRLYSRFLNIPVGRKLILVYLIGIFLPLFISSLYFTARLVTEAKIQQQNSLNNSVDSLVRALEKEMEPLNIIAQSITADTAIYRLIQQEYPDKRDYFKVHYDYLKPTLDKYTAGFDLIGKIIIFVDNPTIGTSSGYMTLNNINRSSEWYRVLQQDSDRSIIFSYTENDRRISYEDEDVLSLFRIMKSSVVPSSREIILRMDIRKSMLSAVLANSPLLGSLNIKNTTTGEIIVSYDDLGNLKESSLSHMTRNLYFPPEWAVSGNVTVEGTSYMDNFRFTDFFLIVFLTIALSLLFIFLLSISVTSRIRLLSAYMRKVERQDFSPIEIENSGDDEIGRLMKDFNIMAERIDFLINQVYRSNLEKNRLMLSQKQAELNNLQSQVNPHFLNNVLESIRMRSLIKDEDETAAIMLKLSRLFRRMLGWEEDLIPLEEEMMFTGEYLEIQQYRFREHLSFSINEDFSRRKWKIPKMTVQGIVENACIHGLENKKDPGRLEIIVTETEEQLTISVIDDGIGFDPEKSETGTGLSNIRERLRLHYGNECSFSIDSSIKKGTRVEIIIPSVYTRMGNKNRREKVNAESDNN